MLVVNGDLFELINQEESVFSKLCSSFKSLFSSKPKADSRLNGIDINKDRFRREVTISDFYEKSQYEKNPDNIITVRDIRNPKLTFNVYERQLVYSYSKEVDSNGKVIKDKLNVYVKKLGY